MNGRSREVLRVEGLVKRFGGLTAVHEISFAVPANSIAAIIGPNGAGKTTLFHLITGFQRPDEGRVYFNDDEMTGRPPEQIAAAGLVRTFQIVRQFARMSALENVLVGFHLKTRGGVGAAILVPPWVREQEDRIRKQGHELLGLVGLEGLDQVTTGNLSYGQQKLLEIARALAAGPKLLMLDEPAAGLTAPETAALSTLILRIRERGISVLLVEHDMSLVMGIANQVHVLDFGERIASGSPAEIQTNPAVIAAYLGSASTTRNPPQRSHDV